MHLSLTKYYPHTTLHSSSIILHINHITQRNHITTHRNTTTIPLSITRRLSITHREGIKLAIEAKEEQEEVDQEVEDKWYVTIISNQDIMQENVYFHQQLVCIVAHRIMTWKNVLHY
jgi:hypothetical protein